jgi:hypothetical protein
MNDKFWEKRCLGCRMPVKKKINMLKVYKKK